jgi:RNA polymerase sigma-70 factor (ECF subfamily)
VESDSQLVVRAQSGDQQAFAELVRRYSALVFRLAVSILGREFIPEAEDVAQEVFLKVHHAIKSFRGEAEFSSWIYRITFNQAVNLKARVRFRSPHADETLLYQAVSPGPGPYRQAEAAQRDQALAECIKNATRGLPIGPTTVLLAGRRRRRSGGIARRFPRILPNRMCIARASFSMAC